MVCRRHGGTTDTDARTGKREFCSDCEQQIVSEKRVRLRRALRSALNDELCEKLDLTNLSLGQLEAVAELCKIMPDETAL